ncbi:MAG: hypothetical protein R3E87_03100 [Burkholderiaceae bacterium]
MLERVPRVFCRFGAALVATALLAVVLAPAAHAARFDHPSGLGFDYPGDWTLQPQGEMLALLPPGGRIDRGQEFILVGGENLGGITQLDDPRVLQWFDAQMQASFGDVRRTGQQALAPAGMQLEYMAGGQRHVVRYRFKGPLGVFVIHLAESPARAGVGRQVFTSLGGELARDPALIGVWTRTKTSGTDITYSGGASGSFVASESRYAYRFEPDGRVMYSAKSTIFGQVSGAGANSTLLGDGDPDVDRGQYVANGSSLWILWANGNWSEWQYRVFPHQGSFGLKLTAPGRDKPLYYEKR